MSLSLSSAIFLFAMGILGGIMNAVAGGGTFFVFPALLFTGVPPVPAKATNTVALWPGLAASVRAFWPRLSVTRRLLVPLVSTSLVGGVVGAALLIRTPADLFMRLVPWLMLAATVLFAVGPRLSRGSAGRGALETSTGRIALATLVELVVAVYGGYFSGGIGILILALLAALGMSDIHDMNALKIILTTIINGVAVVTFIAARAVYWQQALVILFGAVLGGHFGAHYSQRLPAAWVRGFVLLVGTGMTAYFFLRAF
jgi:uncharacterized membrane protein YfcA